MWRRDGYSEKNHTIQVFHTAHIVLDRDGSSNVTTHDIKAFARQLYFPVYNFYLFFFVTINPEWEHCPLTPKYRLFAFLLNTSREKSLHLKLLVWLCIVPVPHLTAYYCWLEQRGGVAICVIVPQPEDLCSISPDNQYPTYRGALHQDFLQATGLHLWRDAGWAGTNPDRVWQSDATYCLWLNFPDVALANHIRATLKPGSLLSTVFSTVSEKTKMLLPRWSPLSPLSTYYLTRNCRHVESKVNRFLNWICIIRLQL